MKILETPRTYLREWELSDLPALERICSDDETMRFMRTGCALTPEETGERLSMFINHQMQHGFSYWAVVLKNPEEVVGHCGLKYMPDSPEIEVGYGFRGDQWGQGLATETASACLDYGFRQRGFDAIIGIVREQNAGSRRVLEKIGMTLERTRLYQGSEWLQYSIPRSAWPNPA